RLDQRHIDAVERRAAHQPDSLDRPHAPLPLFLCAGPVTPTAQPYQRRARHGSTMSAYKSDFLNILAERGFIHQISEPEALDSLAAAGPITAYIGFDCTASSLHVGSLLPI